MNGVITQDNKTFTVPLTVLKEGQSVKFEYETEE